MPVSMETLGSWAPMGLKFVKDIGARITDAHGDKRSTNFLFQAIGIAGFFFGHFEKNSRPKKLKPKKNSSKFSKNSSKSFKNSIICQLKTDFFAKKVMKLIYFAQKFAQT